jgi:hypothetical protein
VFWLQVKSIDREVMMIEGLSHITFVVSDLDRGVLKIWVVLTGNGSGRIDRQINPI